MKYLLKYLDDTIADRASIQSYLSQFYPNTAKRFFTQFKKKTTRLKQFPYSCPIYNDDPDYRVLVVNDYLVFYMINEDMKTVEIHRILHGSRNISQLLNISEKG